MTPLRSIHSILLLPAVAATVLLVLVAPAVAKTYSDVPKSHWARSYIDSVTNRSVSGKYFLLHDFGKQFKPERAITRQLLARSITLASGHYGQKYTPVEIKDVPKGHRYYKVIQIAVTRGYMDLDKAGNFKPDAEILSSTAETAMIRWLSERYSTYDWSLLKTLAPAKWTPNPDWKTGAPAYLPAIVASRQLQLRYNHPSGSDGHETVPQGKIDRAEIAYMFYRAYQVKGSWQLSGLAGFKTVTFDSMSDRQKEVATFALKYIGYPYVWAGEYPKTNSPYGKQASGGFDCSGFVFYVMKMHFGYNEITTSQRGAGDMAAKAKKRITRANLKCGDLIFFGPKGPKSSVGSIYHAGLYLGKGWFIHSTGSSDGVTLASLNSSEYWKTNFAWGRRVLTTAQLVVPTPTASAKGAATPEPQAPAASSSASPSAVPSPSPSQGS